MPTSVFTELWLPLAVALVVMAPGAVLGGRTRRRRLVPVEDASTPPAMQRGARGVLAPLSIALGLAAMHVFAVGRPGTSFPGLTERLLPAFVLAGILGAASVFVRSALSAGAVALAAAASAGAIALWPMLASPEQRWTGWTLVLGASLACAVSVAALRRGAQSGHAVSSGVVLTGLGLAIGGALLGAGNMKLGQFGLAVGAASLPIVIAARVSPPSIAPAATTALAILSTLLVSANRYAYLRPSPPLLFVLVAPVMLLVEQLLRGRLRPWVAGLLSVIAAGLIAAVAMALCVDLTGTDDAAAGGDDYGYGP